MPCEFFNALRWAWLVVMFLRHLFWREIVFKLIVIMPSWVQLEEFAVALFLLTSLLVSNYLSESSLISQSEVVKCNYGDSSEPTNADGEHCKKKMVVAMSLRSGQASWFLYDYYSQSLSNSLNVV